MMYGSLLLYSLNEQRMERMAAGLLVLIKVENFAVDS